jgi:hypothetical protein
MREAVKGEMKWARQRKVAVIADVGGACLSM